MCISLRFPGNVTRHPASRETVRKPGRRAPLAARPDGAEGLQIAITVWGSRPTQAYPRGCAQACSADGCADAPASILGPTGTRSVCGASRLRSESRCSAPPRGWPARSPLPCRPRAARMVDRICNESLIDWPRSGRSAAHWCSSGWVVLDDGRSTPNHDSSGHVAAAIDGATGVKH